MKTNVIAIATSRTSTFEDTRRKQVFLPGQPSKDFVLTAPCRILKKGSTVSIFAKNLPGQSGGTFAWETDSKLIKLSSGSGSSIKVLAIGDHGSGRDSETITVSMVSSDGTRKSKTVKLTIAKVAISASPNQLYGFDDFDSPDSGEDDHVSVKSGAHTFVTVTIVGGATSADFSFDSANSEVCKVIAPANSTSFDLQVLGGNAVKKSTLLEIKVRCPSKERFAGVTVHVYAEKIARVRICKLADLGRPNTHLQWPDADYASHAPEVNRYLKAAVARLEMENFSWNKVSHLPFDGVGGDALRYDLGDDAGGEYIDRVRKLLRSNSARAYDIVIVRKLEFGFYLAVAAKAGDTTISVRGPTFREGLDAEFLDGARSETSFVVKGLHTSVGTLQSPLQFDHPAGTFIRLPDILGTARDIVLMQESAIAKEIVKWVVAHEAVHACFKLRDLDDTTNMMNWRVKTTVDYRIRYMPKPLKKYAGTESQWDRIERN